MSKAIRVYEPGGPEVMRLEDVEVGAPGPGELRIRHHAIGLNFVEVYYRTGLYKLPLPFTPGNEGAGEVTAVGAGVAGFTVGDRVGYAATPGSYAQERLIAAQVCVRLPDAVSNETAAAMMLKGLTARMLLRRCYRVKAGDVMLVHAAAGGVGNLLCQWGKHLGATVIGTAGAPEKIELAKRAGCDHVIAYAHEDFVARVADLTKGAKCDVVYDGVGQATFPGSLDCLKRFGMFVSFGSASGPIEAFNIGLLNTKGSLYATRPTLFHSIDQRADLEEAAADLFAVVASGAVTIPITQRFALADVAEAHRALEGRKTTGATVLIP